MSLVREKLVELILVSLLGTKAKHSLKYSVYHCIDRSHSFEKIKKLKPLKPYDIEPVKQHIPEYPRSHKCTDPRSARLFTLL